jgi:hypothetical protein
MKTLTLLLVHSLLLTSAFADIPQRANLDQDMPLSEALAEANKHYPPGLPLTEDEVVAAIDNIKLKHPTIPDDLLAVYQRIAKERVLPKGVYFSHITGFIPRPGSIRYIVDWRDLTLDGKYNYRIRARYVSRDPVEIREAPMTKQNEK